MTPRSRPRLNIHNVCFIVAFPFERLAFFAATRCVDDTADVTIISHIDDTSGVVTMWRDCARAGVTQFLARLALSQLRSLNFEGFRVPCPS